VKHSSFLTGIVFSCAIISSCGPQTEKETEKELTRLGNYLDSVKAATPEYTAEGWRKIKSEYNNTIEKVENSGEKLSEAANNKLEAAKAEYNALKTDYEIHIREVKEKENLAEYKHKLRRELFGDEKIGSDMQFEFVTAKNALPVYDRFVHTVKENQDKYSREDWDEIKLLYEALDTRKNEIEKDLASSDNMEIAKLKVQFASINTLKRPLSKIEENEDAKN
jgi:hypothetical protein